MEKIYRTTVRKLIALVAVLSHGKDMTMTEEDKKLIGKYMGWNPYPPECMGKTVFYRDETHGDIRWDANASALCVQEMQKRGEYNDFYWRTVQDNDCADFSAWLFNADNFFTAMAQWIKEGK